VDSYRLAYLADAPVNWCPALGTVLANEEVTADGRSERGNHPVFKRPLEQWMLRITTYADRLLDDLDLLDWPESIKIMQRNWIGRSLGAEVGFPVEEHEGVEIDVFTTRPDTLFGATYMVLAPEHPLLDTIVPSEWPQDSPFEWRGTFGLDKRPGEAVASYREFANAKTDLERQAEGRDKTGVFTGAFAKNPTSGWNVPIFVADYVLMGYGTGAIMAVPGHDERDFEFAQTFSLPIVCVVQPPAGWLRDRGVSVDTPADAWPEAYTGDGVNVNSANADVSLDGLATAEAKARIASWLEETGAGAPAVTYKLRDWLFSRQRYWGEPFPIVYDDLDRPVALPESLLPVELPEITDFEPRILADDDVSLPELPLARARDWVNVELDLGDGPMVYRRETNTMPQWAGSCWYYLRYLDPTNENELVDPIVERYWMVDDRGPDAGGVDLYVGGAEHAVLHLLYARFWHKVLYDLGHVSTPEPFHRLFNQGTITAAAYTDARGAYVDAAEVVARDGGYFLGNELVDRHDGKMGKSLKNAVAPDDIYRDYGADTLRLYEMFMGPLDASRPWSTADIIGVHRLLQRLWRNLVDEDTGEVLVTDDQPVADARRALHRTIATVKADMADLKFNTAIARLFELTNVLIDRYPSPQPTPRELAEPLVLMLAPLTPHVAEELWERLGRDVSLAFQAFPEFDPALLVDEEIEVPVQVNGKVRARVHVASGANEDDHERVARADPRIAELLVGATVRKVVVVPGRTVNFVLG
jgi:leucyl-tRNA synthetase